MGAHTIMQDKYVAISACRKSIREACSNFKRVNIDLIVHFVHPESLCIEHDAEEKFRIFYDFKNFIYSDTFEFWKDCSRMNERYGSMIFLP